MKTLLAIALSAFLGLSYVGPSLGQSPTGGQTVITVPKNSGSGGTVTTGGTLPVSGNLALAANGNRQGCIIQNQGANNMKIATNSAMTAALNLAAGATFNCAGYLINIGDPIYITGTAADVYVLWWQ